MILSTARHREKALRNPGYWVSKIQFELFDKIRQFMSLNKKNNSRSLAKKLDVTPGYISQIMNGNFDHKISKFVELSLAIGKVPIIRYEDIEDIIRDENKAIMQPKIFQVNTYVKINIKEQTSQHEKIYLGNQILLPRKYTA